MTRQAGDSADFAGLQVVSFESRRAQEMAALISNHGGVPLVAPSMREIPLEENPAAFVFAEQLFSGQLDAIIFLTGVGTRALWDVLEKRYAREEIVRALSQLVVVARGPKPVKVLRDLGVPVTVSVPEPNTWREILQVLDKSPQGFSLAGSRVAVQEYGGPNELFLKELGARGAAVVRVPVYRWALPENREPLRPALEAILAGRARMVLWTNAVQVEHVLRVAAEDGVKQRLLDALERCVICSVGPTCSEALLANGISVDLEPQPHKMGILVHESARRAAELLRRKTWRLPGS